jgi:opacity protein-like surface antigen
MKNLSVALLAAAALSTSAIANNGFYLGASAGVAQTNAKYSWTNNNQTAGLTTIQNNPAYTQIFNADTGKAAGLFGLFAGYGALVGSGMYVGGEIYGGFDTTNFNPFNDQSAGPALNGGASGAALWKTTLKKSNYYGLAVRFGVMATPSTLIYLRLAAEAGKWKATITPAPNAAITTGSNSWNATNASKTGINFAPGAGVEVYLNKNIFVRAEYRYLFGPKINMTQDISGYSNANAVAGTQATHSLKTSQHSMTVGVGYKF